MMIFFQDATIKIFMYVCRIHRNIIIVCITLLGKITLMQYYHNICDFITYVAMDVCFVCVRFFSLAYHAGNHDKQLSLVLNISLKISNVILNHSNI